MPLEGVAPEARHSHSACSYQGGVVVFGGLSRGGVPLGDMVVLRPTDVGFCWERIDVHPPPVPRSAVFVIIQRFKTKISCSEAFEWDLVFCVQILSLCPCDRWEAGGGGRSLAPFWRCTRHSSHQHEHAQQCGVLSGHGKLSFIHLMLWRSGLNSKPLFVFCCVQTLVSWPLMLHSFCTELLESEEPELLLIGGGGNCFSFGTHWNCQLVNVNLRHVLLGWPECFFEQDQRNDLSLLLLQIKWQDVIIIRTCEAGL